MTGRSALGWFASLKRGLSLERPEDPISDQTGHRGSLSRLRNLYPFLGRHWRKWVIGAALFLSAALLAFPAPLITRYLIDHVILGRQLGLLLWVVLLLAAVSLTGRVAKVFEQFYFTRLEQTIILNIQHDLFERVLRFPKSFFDGKQVGYLMSRLSTDVEGLRWFFAGTLVHIAENIVRFFGGIALLLYINWRLSIAVVVILPGVVYIVRYFSGKLHALSHRGMEQQAHISGRFQESLSTVPLIKAFSSEDHVLRRLMSEMKAACRISLEQTAVSSLANITIGSLPDVARVIVLAVGAYWVIKGEWTLGSLFAFQAYLVYVYGPARFLASSNLELQRALAALERVSALFDIVLEENVGKGRGVERLSGEVEFKNVSFSYNGREPVLQDVCFHISPGEHVGIVGPSGVGKTTLMSLILCFYRPGAGQILFDGRSASEYEVRSLRRRIGYVSQNTLLVSGTIMDNLCYGNTDATPEQTARAARVAGIHAFIEGLPKGYETQIGEGGIRLSEGQRQRLSIARALVKEPDILVLDEPTSSLDSVTEMSIFRMLPESVRGKTMFVAAHRLSTIETVDRILLLDENRLVATGTHQSLLDTNDYYRSVVSHQKGSVQGN